MSINEPEKNIETKNSTQGYCSMVKPFTSKEVEPINIMPAIIVFATNGFKSQKVRIAFDTMFQDTFITEEVAKRHSVSPLIYRS